MNAKISFSTLLLLAGASLLVGVLYLAPLLLIQKHLAASGQPFVFAFESYRNDLTYLAWAREIYDGHFPPRDPFSDGDRPMLVNSLPPLILAGFMALARGDVPHAYFGALFIFSQLNFFAFYLLGHRLTRSRVWALCLALIAVLTPMALRIFNFDGTA